jgi:hypothetical protein
MKLFKNMMAITALFLIGSISARQRGAAAAQTAVKPAAPTRQPVVAQGKSFKDLRAKVLSKKPNDVVDGKTELLKETFIQEIMADANNSGLGEDPRETLLKTARDKFVSFPASNENALDLLRRINAQIDDSI